MEFKKMVPILLTSSFEGIKEFYQEHFGFRVVVDSPGFLSLSPENQDAIEISFMKPGEESQTEFNQQGLYYSFEVENVDAEYERLIAKSLAIPQPPQDNPWGDRSFTVSAPAGVVLYIYKPIPPNEQYK